MTLQLSCSRIVDGSGRDPFDGSVTIDGDRIIAVDRGAAPGARKLEGLTLLPGLIDAHTHLGLVDMAGDGTTPLAAVAAHIFRNCELALEAGFTTARDCGGVDGGLARAIEAGLVGGPRLFPSGPILCQTGGHGDLTPPFADHHNAAHAPGLVQAAQVCDGPHEVRVAARRALRRGATQVKVCVSGGVVSLSDSLEDTQFTVGELRAAVEEAQARDTYVTAHAHNVGGIRNGIEAGIACFEHGTFLDAETAERMARAGAALVPTLAVTRVFFEEWRAWGLPEEVVPRMAGIEDAMSRSVKLAQDAGITIGSGSDLLGTSQNRRGLELAMKAKILGPMAAIVSATSTNARILRASDRLGTIEFGKVADLIAVDFDPLSEPDMFDDPSRVVLVIKAGQIVKDTLTAP
jgi:imidazolonepropionase-like amidohydrolase